MQNSRLYNIDVLKGVACILVVLIHSQFPGTVGVIVKTTARMGVPFFFMVSGYFCLSSNGTNYMVSNESLKRKIYHITKIIVYSTLFYATFHLGMYIIWGDLTIHDEFQKYVTIQRITWFIITNSPFCYLHIWFLFALIYCYAFVLVARKIILNFKINLLFTLFLLIGYVVLSEFFPLINLNITPPYWHNVFVFRALPFFLMGIMLRMKMEEINLLVQKIGWGTIILIAILSILLSIFERLNTIESQIYIGTIIYTLITFIIGITNIKSYSKILEYIGSNLSMYVYVLHIAVIAVVSKWIKVSPWITPILVIILSLFVSFLVYKIRLVYENWNNNILANKR